MSRHRSCPSLKRKQCSTLQSFPKPAPRRCQLAGQATGVAYVEAGRISKTISSSRVTRAKLLFTSSAMVPQLLFQTQQACHGSARPVKQCRTTALSWRRCDVASVQWLVGPPSQQLYRDTMRTFSAPFGCQRFIFPTPLQCSP